MRPEKKSIVDELRSKVSSSSFVILADYRGLSVAKTDELRRRLRGVSAQFQVIQNRLFRLVAKELAFTGFEDSIKGPSAMVFGQGDVVQAAKVLRDFIRENEKPVIKLGAMEGTALSAADVTQLAGLPSKQELYAMLVRTLAAPMTQLVGVLQQKVASIVYVLKAVEEKKGKS